MVAPISNPRIDVVTLRNDGSLYVIPGSEAGSPTQPTIPSTDVPICSIYHVVGETVIHDNDAQVAGQGYIQYDLRPFVQVAVGSSAMPKIGLIAKVQNTLPSSGSVDVVNFSGAGRLRCVHWTGGSSSATLTLTVVVDGITICSLSVGSPFTDRDLYFVGAASTTMLSDQAGSSTSRVFLDIFFKTSLVIHHAQTGGGADLTTTVEYERE